MTQALPPYFQEGSLSSAEQHRVANPFLPSANPFFPTPALLPSVGAEERVVQNSKARGAL